MSKDVINDVKFGDYKGLLLEAIKVGPSVYKDGVVDKLRDTLGENALKPEYLFSSVESIVSDEIHNVLEHIKKVTKKDKLMAMLSKKAEMNRKVSDLTKLSYLSSVFLGTMEASKEYHINHGGVAIPTPEETVFFANQNPLILQEIYKAAEGGAKFNPWIFKLIGSINRKDTDSQKGSD